MAEEKVQIESDGRLIVPATVCAAALGVTVRTLSKWTVKGCPREARNRYDLCAVIKWKYSTDNTPTSLEAMKQKADIRYREARADNEEIKHRALVGEYVAVEDVEREVTELLTQVRIGLLGIKQKTLQRLHSTYPECAFDVGKLVEQEIERGLSTLAKGEKIKG